MIGERNYRDIHEYHDKCYYCVCKDCKITNCLMVKCEFCNGGISDSKKKCTNKKKKQEQGGI